MSDAAQNSRQTQVQKGLATRPSYSFLGDATTGFYQSATGKAGFATGGALITEFSSTGLAVTGSLSVTTPVTPANGGTGLSAVGTAGNLLTSNGSAWVSSAAPATPIIPSGVSSGLKIQATSNTAVTITASQVVINSTTVTYTTSAISLTLGTGTSGANGLDTGTIAASTWYAVWAIYNGTTVAGLLSLSSTAPTMPSGYTYKARIGWVRTDGSSNLLRTIQYGTRAQYITSASGFPVVASGNTGGVWAAYSTANFAPSTAGAIVVGAVKANVNATMGAHPNNAIAIPTSSPLAMLYSGNNSNFGVPAGIQGTMMLETTNIYWFSDTGSANLYAQGWVDNV
jgi:hypothetical protein